MLGKLIATLFILTLTFFLSHQQLQNLCGDDANITHVLDPSSCHLFLRCERFQELTIAYPGSCYGVGANADYAFRDGNNRVWCSNSNAHCSNLCPPTSQPDVMVADPNDRTCRRHRPCRATTANYSECATGLRFNRNSGLCDLPSYAPCTSVPLPLACSAGTTGFFPGNTCYQYIFCENGVLRLTLECSVGMYFNATTQSCLFGPCARTMLVDEMLYQLPMGN